ncbi:hypothetical protein CJ030_MR6G021530 [Morella rubra]|uniref:Uncharacterized protein n=1 Tax=Morella rubra TaxID=262757 RepID=A0A6A1VJP3_9ROSI|nr:hypothetical protein CJ030_MR6G021530 [Morella rubra]
MGSNIGGDLNQLVAETPQSQIGKKGVVGTGLSTEKEPHGNSSDSGIFVLALLKVVRASSSSTEKTNEPIEIPPPRPKKKKPLHPYPRKSVDSPNGISAANQSERSPSPNSLVAEKDTKPPPSVFSAARSDSLGSSVSVNMVLVLMVY